MNPFAVLLLLFLSVPLVEIYFLIKVGGWIGAVPTVFMVVFTAVLGALLLRFQGFSTLQRLQLSMARGELPAVEMLEGVVLVISGVLLLTPGFFTDALGFLGLIPPLRQALIRAWIARQLGGGPPPGAGPAGGQPKGPVTLEGEYTRENDK
ncbi:fxsA cytoplasmic membrane protein [Thiohalobacter thiocyanaticus]|uniref:FxsA cytoplasmic membrane protein n=1 Tax=Thiohalobacter thiocyanaticus TaxID=585455 RepID=A0A1Z4VNJ7_9GAMM|nr:FxsA family protein [Thiohalobacter thiocyanaticus]BAZ93002.1 fxsA cytoplasmic membrane protein [Thiohalobacter thiocyanaticus]